MEGRATIILGVLLVVGLVPAVGSAFPSAELTDSGATMEVNIQASEDVLREIVNDRDFEATYTWYEINWIGGTLGAADYAELKARPDVTVEDAEYHEIQCHANDPCDDGSSGPSDQTPYGIEQIYDDSTITATSGGDGVVLGHLDTGIDTDHPDLVNRIVFADGEDKNDHGTHTAGTAAADAGSDDTGIYGVASDASIRSYKVCNNGGLCSTTDITSAIQDCTNNGDRKCDVITYSIGSDSSSSSISDAVDAFTSAGGLFVAAAGNDGSDLGTIDFPAWKDNTVAVAAIDETKTVADFSSRGDDDGNCGTTKYDVDFAAAGVDVESTVTGGGYDTFSGTSMATPHVSGLSLKEWGGDGATTYSNLQSKVLDITDGLHATSGCDPASGQGLPQVG